MENNNNVVEEVVEVVAETKVEEAKKGLFDKPKAFLQKHSKGIKTTVKVALITLGGAAVYALGKQAGINSVEADDYDYLQDGTNDDDYDSENKTTEF